MVTPDRGDDEFERALLRSASRDAPDAEETQRAWSRFAGAMASLAPPATGPRAGHVPPVTGSVGRWSRVANATTWLAIGAIGGCAVTFALVGRRGEAPTVSAPARSSAAPATASPPRIATWPLTQAAPPGSALPAPQPSARVGSSSSTSRSGDHRLAQRPGELARTHDSPASGRAASSDGDDSTLAAEVAALDAARSALDLGMTDDALALLRRYPRDFPSGKLVPEAEVMGIEALAAKGEHAEATREANRFLERYPSAPQRGRVEKLRAEEAQK
jgi:hypothetical protein